MSGFSYQPCKGGFNWRSYTAQHPKHGNQMPKYQQVDDAANNRVHLLSSNI